ncbi:MAG: ligase-associated DNA damage response endonuclease PdeM [Bacteroidota bacterium]
MYLPIHLHNEELQLHHSGAVFWKTRNMLLIADLHFGKITHFRKYGSAVPQNAIQRNFDQLNQVTALFKPKTICFLGDLFHSYLNQEWELFKSWTTTIKSEILLVSGNHDIISPLLYEEIGIKIQDKLFMKPFFCTHHPEKKAGFINICGHIHPAVRLTGMGRQSIKLACFFTNEEQFILPAFGAFTGTHVMKPSISDAVYAIAEEKVMLV